MHAPLHNICLLILKTTCASSHLYRLHIMKAIMQIKKHGQLKTQINPPLLHKLALFAAVCTGRTSATNKTGTPHLKGKTEQYIEKQHCLNILELRIMGLRKL